MGKPLDEACTMEMFGHNEFIGNPENAFKNGCRLPKKKVNSKRGSGNLGGGGGVIYDLSSNNFLSRQKKATLTNGETPLRRRKNYVWRSGERCVPRTMHREKSTCLVRGDSEKEKIRGGISVQVGGIRKAETLKSGEHSHPGTEMEGVGGHHGHSACTNKKSIRV